MSRRRLLCMRDLIESALKDIKAGAPRLTILRRLYWQGVPFDVALRIFGRI